MALPTDDIESLVQNQQKSTSYMTNLPGHNDVVAQRGKDSFSAEHDPAKSKSTYINQPNRPNNQQQQNQNPQNSQNQQQQASVVKKTPTTDEVSALGSIQQNDQQAANITPKKKKNKLALIIIGSSIAGILLIGIIAVIIVGFVTNWKFS